ncbi:DNA-binding transcriptional regulator [Azoarcus sp. KH32C]|uniref:helix-turn-helix domain-containing protein n=1 Tax=Azoarcus sp. KH32C TaxID=748247 RepID=UPI001E65D41B|nr:XRE family transcriptional regulator [Azoarcus sp. KH32C]
MTAKPRKQPALRFKSGDDVSELRKKLGLNQTEFWNKLSVTQSGGSRYESGRSIPGPVRLLLHLTYGTEKQAGDLLDWLRQKE